MAGIASSIKGVLGVGGGAVGALAGADTAMFLGDEVGGPLLDSLTKDGLREDIARSNRAREGQLLTLLRTRREAQAKQENLVRLSQMHPEVYNQVAAGRRLPRGAMVFGGRPDQEALDRVATAMANGTL